MNELKFTREEREQFFVAMARRMMATTDFATHSENVKNYSLIVYDNLDNKSTLPSKEIVGYCGEFHDLGKYFISQAYEGLMELKTFKESDREKMESHTNCGNALIKSIAKSFRLDEKSEFVSNLINSNKYHHLSLNNSGYPKTTVKQPLIAQLVQVADCYSAGIEERAYKESKTPEVVLGELFDSCKRGELNPRFLLSLQKGLIDKEIIKEEVFKEEHLIGKV